jgi:O-antigen/teichoic acid export membrane protein
MAYFTRIPAVLIRSAFNTLIRIAALPKYAIETIHRIRLYRNAVFLALNSILSGASNFVFWVVAARFYSSSDVGVASALIASVALLNSVSLLGLNYALIRFLPEEDNPHGMINSSLSIVGLFSMALALIFVAGIPFWSPALSLISGNLTMLLLFTLFTVVTSLFLMQGQTFIALGSAGFTFSQQMIFQGSKVVLIALFVSFGAFGIFSSWSAAALISALLANLFFMRKIHRDYVPAPVLKMRAIKKMARFSLGNYVADVLTSAPTYLIPLMIVNVLGTDSGAYYRIAFGIASMLFAIPFAVTTSLFSEGSSNPQDLRHHLIKAIKFMLILLVPSILLVLVLSDKLLLIFGQQYAESGLSLLRILALSSLPVGIIELYLVVMRVQLRIKTVLCTYASVTIIIVLGSYWLGGHVGLMGVGYSWILGQGLVAIVLSVLTVKWLRKDNSSGGT